jgi:hypothetical protein
MLISPKQRLIILKRMSQQFVDGLAKSDLAYYYKECLAGIEVRRK